MCHFEFKNTHIIYMTKWKCVVFELKSIHAISIYVTPQLGKFKQKCVILN